MPYASGKIGHCPKKHNVQIKHKFVSSVCTAGILSSLYGTTRPVKHEVLPWATELDTHMVYFQPKKNSNLKFSKGRSSKTLDLLAHCSFPFSHCLSKMFPRFHKIFPFSIGKSSEVLDLLAHCSSPSSYESFLRPFVIPRPFHSENIWQLQFVIVLRLLPSIILIFYIPLHLRKAQLRYQDKYL